MARKIRIKYNGAVYHVMNRGAGRRYVLNDENDNKETFLFFLSEIVKKYQIEIYAFCIMDNHYHLLLKTPLANISEAIKYIQSMYTRTYNIKNNSDGSIFRGRYKSILIDSDAYLLQAWKYIHLNPVEANLSEGINYKWSSYRYYADKNKSLPWLHTEIILNLFSKSSVHQKFNLDSSHFDTAHKELHDFYTKTCRNNFDILNEKSIDRIVNNREYTDQLVIFKNVEASCLKYFNTTKQNLYHNQKGKINYYKVTFIIITINIFECNQITLAEYMLYASSSTLSKHAKKYSTMINNKLLNELKSHKQDIELIISKIYHCLALKKEKKTA